MIKKIMLMLVVALTAFADDATSFSEALPTSMLPDGFWQLVFLIFGAAVTIGGVAIGLKLLKKARG